MKERVLAEVAITARERGAVMRSQRRLWLAEGDPPRPATSLEDRVPGRVGLRDGRTLAGGLAPPGAIRARVTDVRGEHVEATVGDGAWIVVLDQLARAQMDLAICFFDAAGRLLAPTLPKHRHPEPIADAGEPCPACTATAWLLATPGRLRRDTPFALCAACGHEEPLGTWFGPVTSEPVADGPADWAEEFHQRQVAPMLAAIGFTVYAPAGLPVTIGGWGGSDERRADRITLTHHDAHETRLDVETSAGHDHGFSDAAEHARDALTQALDSSVDAGPPDLSQPALSLWLNARRRGFARAAARASVTPLTLTVEGRSRPFVTARSDRDWAAVGRIDDLTLTVTAHAITPEQVHLRGLTSVAALRMGA